MRRTLVALFAALVAMVLIGAGGGKVDKEPGKPAVAENVSLPCSVRSPRSNQSMSSRDRSSSGLPSE